MEKKLNFSGSTKNSDVPIGEDIILYGQDFAMNYIAGQVSVLMKDGDA